MEVGLKFVLVVLLLPIVQVLPLEWVNDGQYDYTCSSDSVIELRIAELKADSVNATIRLATADEEILPYVSLSCHNVGSKSAFHGDSCDNLFKDGQMLVVEVKVHTITLPVISNHTLQVVVEVNAEIDELKPVNLLVLDGRKLQVRFSTQELELRDNAIMLHVEVLNKPLSLGADLELRITLTDEHQQEIIQNFTLASNASEQLVVFGGLNPSLVYTAQLSVVDPAQQGRVLLVTPTARLHIALEDVLDTHWRALFDKVSKMYQKASALFEESVRLHQDVKELLNPSTTEDTTATMPTEATTDPDTITAATGVATLPPATAHVTMATTPAVEAASDIGIVEDCYNAYYWLLFAGFVAVLVLCVLGYLLLIFNHRDKVKVYAVNLWKGAENTSSSKTASRKYTALPTTIHDSHT